MSTVIYKKHGRMKLQKEFYHHISLLVNCFGLFLFIYLYFMWLILIQNCVQNSHTKYCPAVCLYDQKYSIKEWTGWLGYGS